MKLNPLQHHFLILTLILLFSGLIGCEGDDKSTTNITPTEPGNAPIAGFTVNVNGLTVTVTDTSVNHKSISYDWGDGLSDSFASGSHSYLLAGNFTIVQVTSNEFGSATASRTVIVGDVDPSPIAAFEIVGRTGLTVSFRDRSTNAVTWDWDFGDGERDTLRSPNHTYLAPGDYNIILTVANASGNTDRIDRTITLQNLPRAGFTFTIDGLTVTVTDTSSNSDTVEYDWGDGTIDSFRSGTHTYTTAGLFTIRQRVTNTAGSDETSRTVTVTP